MIGQIVKKYATVFLIQDGGDRHLEFVQLYISDVIDMFQIEVPMFPVILVKQLRIGSSVSKFKMAAAAILKSTLPVEPPSREINS